MKLSILDQAPISAGETAMDALETSIKLAQLGDEIGYERYWIAEHHDLYGLASPNPGVMLAAIGSKTSKIRIGAGAVLLPYYKPFQIAETYNLLATLFPGRVDLGLGRAPGGSAEVSMALSDDYLKQVRNYAENIGELTNFLMDTFPVDHPYAKISPTPIPVVSPEMWLLGTSEKSAVLAAEKGLFYCFGDFMTELNGPEIVQSYRQNYERTNEKPAYVIVAINVICASTTEEAEEIALSQIVWKYKQDKQLSENYIPSIEHAKSYCFTEADMKTVNKIKDGIIIGNPQEVTAMKSKNSS